MVTISQIEIRKKHLTLEAIIAITDNEVKLYLHATLAHKKNLHKLYNLYPKAYLLFSKQKT